MKRKILQASLIEIKCQGNFQSQKKKQKNTDSKEKRASSMMEGEKGNLWKFPPSSKGQKKIIGCTNQLTIYPVGPESREAS